MFCNNVLYCTSGGGRERQAALVDEREGACQYGQKCRFDTKTSQLIEFYGLSVK